MKRSTLIEILVVIIVILVFILGMKSASSKKMNIAKVSNYISNTQNETESKPVSTASAKTESKPVSTPSTKTESKPVSTPSTKTESKPVSTPSVKTESKPASTSSSKTESKPVSTSSTTTGSKPSTNTKKNYKIGDTITFAGLKLTFDSTYSFTTLKNSYSEYNERDVIKLGVNVKNVSTEKNSLNMFYYKLFGSKGTELRSVSAFFGDDVIDFAGELKPSAAYKAYFYILYDGNGKYSIDFSNHSEEISVELKVTK